MADAAVLRGQYVVPAKALALGYPFRFPELHAALDDLIS
jgi:NAD dependent epimerase/dehydratase family enzyme